METNHSGGGTDVATRQASEDQDPSLVWDESENGERQGEYFFHQVLDCDESKLEEYAEHDPQLRVYAACPLLNGLPFAESSSEGRAARIKLAEVNGVDVKRLEEKTFEDGCADADNSRWLWQDLLNDLTDWLEEINPDGKAWIVDGRNLGWQHRDAVGCFTTNDGQKFLRAVLPDTQCTFTIYRRRDDEGEYLHISNAHHDAPTGESYTIRTTEAA